MKINYTKLILSITLVNILAWCFLELWIARYADGVAEMGAGWMIAFQLIGYYISMVSSRIDNNKTIVDPKDCEHDWQKSDTYTEKCIICKSKRTIS